MFLQKRDTRKSFLASDLLLYFIYRYNSNLYTSEYHNDTYLQSRWKTLSNLIQILSKAVNNKRVVIKLTYQKTSIEPNIKANYSEHRIYFNG